MTRRPRTESPATDLALALLDALVAEGVRDVVASPGSRSQALALAAAELDATGALRLHVRIDERVAGFTALGLALGADRPAAVIVTSGTAVANLHPAALEAVHAGVPLLLVTADRPEELRGIGSNQTTEQRGVFGPLVPVLDIGAPTSATGSEAEATADAVLARVRDGVRAAAGRPGDSVGASIAEDARRGPRGPLHLNVAFREPLSAAIVREVHADSRDDSSADDASPRSARRAAAESSSRPSGSADDGSRAAESSARPSAAAAAAAAASGAVARLAPEPGTVVVAGDKAGEVAERVARALGAPLLAEVSSGARFGPNAVPAYRRLLREPGFGDAVRRAVVYGHPTLSREVPALLRRTDVEVIIVRGDAAEVYDPTVGRARVVDAVEVDGEADRETDRRWAGRWARASRALLDADAESAGETPAAGLGLADFARHELDAVRAPITRRFLVDAVWRHTWPHDRLVLGASRLIREADALVPGKRIRVLANRGLSGIDGTIATATGVALAAEDAADADGSPPGTTRVLLGDLALLHDAGALLLGVGERRPRVQVIVGDDGGGTIFDTLEVAASTDPAVFDRVLYTPQRVDLAALAAAYGWVHTRATTAGELEQALTAPPGPSIVEVPLER